MSETEHAAPLTALQRVLITAMLTELVPHDIALAQQAGGALGSPNCSCGCPSVWLVLDPAAPHSSRRNTVELLAHHEARQLLATLTINQGLLHELDCTSLGEEDTFPPSLASLDGWGFSVTNRPF